MLVNPIFRTGASRRSARRALVAVACATALALATVLPAAAATPTKSDISALASITAVHNQAAQIAPAAMASLALAQGASPNEGAAIAASAGCWSDSGYVVGHNPLGWVLFQYNESHDWCGDGTYITYTHVYTYPSNTNWGWSYKGDVKNSTWGVGWNLWKENLSGHFCWVENFSCISNAYPWIEFEVGGGGQEYYWHWG